VWLKYLDIEVYMAVFGYRKVISRCHDTFMRVLVAIPVEEDR